MDGRDLLVFLSLKYNGDQRAISRALRAREDYEVEEVSNAISRLRCRYVTICDPDYPEPMRTAPLPPFVLYYYGNLELIRDLGRTISIVGSRKPSAYSLEQTTRLARELAEDGYVIVSGLAKGIDAAALEGAVKYGKSVAILGNGIDYCYPSENKELQRLIKKNGLLISEYPPSSAPSPTHFPERNRLIAAVGNATIITSAQAHSGTLITVAFALSIGRDIGCLPHPAGEDSYCNVLIKEGAMLVESKEDAVSILNPHLRCPEE